MTIFVGSTNPVKVNAVTTAASETWPDVRVVGLEAASGVSAQPMSDEETRTGAVNRATAVLKMGLATLSDNSTDVLGVGLEGGVFSNDQGELWSTVWVVVIDPTNQRFESNGARFRISELFADKIRKGEEMGPLIQRLTGVEDLRKKGGMIGLITHDFVDRTEEYAGIAKLALGLWYGRDWLDRLSRTE